MYHRIGWIGDPAATPPVLSAAAEIISSDLTRRDVQSARQVSSLSDQGWLDLVHSTYCVRAGATP
jgi:hypothetical protein